ncbi:MAG: hypothetical protein ABSG31_09240 [Tepidisphaeraceae bacterium]
MPATSNLIPPQIPLQPMPPPPGAFYWTNPLPPRSARPDSGRDNSNSNVQTWAGTVVIACMAIGLLSAICRFEMARLQAERERAMNLAGEASLVEAQQEDLGKLLSDPDTRLIPLSATNYSDLRGATMAWNERLQRAVLFCDKLPILGDADQYEIWVADSSGTFSRLGGVDAHPGVSVYPIRFAALASPMSRLEITAGPRELAKGPVLVGEIQ